MGEIDLHLEDYYQWVEEGRKPGKMPPVKSILDWVKAKPILPRPFGGKLPSQESLAFLIARSIGKNGTKPQHILGDTLDSMDKHIDDKLSVPLKRT